VGVSGTGLNEGKRNIVLKDFLLVIEFAAPEGVFTFLVS
jgi:hypothetical protein